MTEYPADPPLVLASGPDDDGVAVITLNDFLTGALQGEHEEAAVSTDSARSPENHGK